MNSLLEDFLSLGRLEEGKTVINPTVFDLHELLEGIIEEIEPFKKTGQVILFEHKGKKDITTDRKLLKNIVINLLNNALKFSGENKKVKIKSTVAKNKIELNIKDEGIGMSKDDQRHLFESFYRGKNAQNIQGTGLGLHIVKRYVQLLNGEIKLESSLEEGTTVEVTLKNN
jgi:signal transduction histidine kinase